MTPRKFLFEIDRSKRPLGTALIKSMPKVDSMVWSFAVPIGHSFGYRHSMTRKEFRERELKHRKELRLSPDLFIESCRRYVNDGKKDNLMESHLYMDEMMSNSFKEEVFDSVREVFKEGNVHLELHFPTEGEQLVYNPRGFCGTEKVHLGWSYGRITEEFKDKTDGSSTINAERLKICTMSPGPLGVTVGGEYLRCYLYGGVDIWKLAKSVENSAVILNTIEKIREWTYYVFEDSELFEEG